MPDSLLGVQKRYVWESCGWRCAVVGAGATLPERHTLLEMAAIEEVLESPIGDS